MAICPQCEGEKMDEISCLSDPITIGGESFEPIRWGGERGKSRWVIDFPCRDCRPPSAGSITRVVAWNGVPRVSATRWRARASLRRR